VRSPDALGRTIAEPRFHMKVPSPCIDVCKFNAAGRCVGSGMTKMQRKNFNRLDGTKAKRRCIGDLLAQQAKVGLKANWARVYRRRTKEEASLQQDKAITCEEAVFVATGLRKVQRASSGRPPNCPTEPGATYHDSADFQ
jgi:uncharacterized protein